MALCDDIIDYNKKMESYIEKYGNENHVEVKITSYGSGSQLLLNYQKRKFDVIFLDVSMPEMDGFETAEEIRKSDTDVSIVFCTSYYTITNAGKGFEVAAEDFLSKPLLYRKVENILNKIYKKKLLNAEEKLFLKCHDGLITLQLSDIIYIQTENKLLILHTIHGDVQSSQRMSELEKRLSKKQFFRCHNSYMVNFDYVEGVKKDSVLIKDKVQKLKTIEMCQQAGIKVVLSFIYEKTNERELYRLIDIAAKYDVDVLFNIVSSVGRAKENSEILTDMEHLDMNLKIAKYILKQGYENKKIGGAFYQRIQVRNSCGGYGKVMAIFPEGDIYMCQCMEQNQVRMGNILSDEPQKILQELENLLEKDEIKRLFCAEYKEICKECDYRYICGGRCMASEEPYDYRCIFLKAVLNYVLFYYNSKENRRKNLEIYIEYMEEVKRKWKEKANEEEKRAI